MKIKLNELNSINAKIFSFMRQSVQLLLKPVAFLFLTILIFISCRKNTTTRRTGGGGSDITVIKDVKYGSNIDMLGKNVNLALDVYIPERATATQKFPLVLFVHGGSFTGGDKSSAAKAMEKFADAGFVSVSIDYRLDESLDVAEDPCIVDTGSTQRAVYMSVQDARAAMRFMVANAAKYYIDTTKIFLAGNSAGGITVLNAYFLTQNDFNALIPGVQAELGGINDATNNLKNTFKVIGMAANSGCLPNPNYITTANAIPVIFFHGGEDSTIPIRSGHAYYCPNTLYLYGSISLYERMSAVGEPAVIHVDTDGGHGPYEEEFLTPNEICFFNSILGNKAQSGSYKDQQSSCP